MILSQINLSQVFDLGFIALVSYVCIKNIFSGSPDDLSRRAEGVRTDLRELETALRELIGEAAAASGSLDRSLSKRKSELEQLLKRIDTQSSDNRQSYADPDAEESAPAAAGPQTRGSRAYREQQSAPPLEAELPNSSWVLGNPSEASPEEVAHSLRDLIEKNDDSVTLSSDIEKFAEARRAKAASAAARTAAKPAAPKAALGAALAKRLQEAKAEEPEYIPAYIEPGAFKVAKRLLLAGQELHVVSRKLDLPLADVRVIERLVRGGWDETSADGAPGAAVGGLE